MDGGCSLTLTPEKRSRAKNLPVTRRPLLLILIFASDADPVFFLLHATASFLTATSVKRLTGVVAAALTSARYRARRATLPLFALLRTRMLSRRSVFLYSIILLARLTSKRARRNTPSRNIPPRESLPPSIIYRFHFSITSFFFPFPPAPVFKAPFLEALKTSTSDIVSPFYIIYCIAFLTIPLLWMS